METHLKPSLIRFLGNRAIGKTSGEDLVEWAVSELMDGKDTPQLRVLAGLDLPIHWSEADALLKIALAEMGIELPSPEECLWFYCQHIAKDILEDQITALEGCILLYQVYLSWDYLTELQVWDQLESAWWDIRDEVPPFTYPEATKNNFTDLVKKEARDLLLLEMPGF